MLALQDPLAALKHWRSRDGATPCWHQGVGGDRWCLKELIPQPAVLLVSALLLLGAGTSSPLLGHTALRAALLRPSAQRG